jgi:transposase
VSDKKPSSRPAICPSTASSSFLEPLDVDRLIDDDHAARRIWRVVEQLDLSRFAADVRAVEGVAGRPSHSPQVLAAVWIYAFSKNPRHTGENSREVWSRVLPSN